MLNKFENYIFDLDGTIVDSSNEILKCLKKAFQDNRCTIPAERFTPNLIGPPIRQIIENVAPEIKEEDVKKGIISSFRKNYDFDNDDCSSLYPQIREYLDFLKNSNKKLYIATFKPKIPTLRLVKMFNLDMFDSIYTVDYPHPFTSKSEMVKSLLKEQNLELNETVIIGDSVSDILAGKTNDINAVGVLWGYGKDKSQMIKQADYIIENTNILERVKI